MNTWEIFEAVVKAKKINPRILLYGVPGTGKTTQANKTAKEDDVYNITVNEESSVAEILGMWIPKDNSFKWMNGVAIRAWLEGKLLVINEIDKASGSVLTILNALLDDQSVAKITLPKGKTVKPVKGFRVIATMNGEIEDLPESLSDRFDLKLNIESPHPDAIKSLPEDLRDLVDAAYSRKQLSVSFREIQAFGKLRETLGDDAYIVFGDMANDIKATLKLGKREIDDESSDDVPLVHEDVDTLVRYYDNTDELFEEPYIKVLLSCGATIGETTMVRRIFQVADDDNFTKAIDNLHYQIVRRIKREQRRDIREAVNL